MLRSLFKNKNENEIEIVYSPFVPEFISDFKQNSSEKDRSVQSYRVLSQYSHKKFPIIIDRGNIHSPMIDKHKYIIDGEMRISEIFCILRSKLNLASSDAIFIFIDNTIPRMTSTIKEIYNQKKDSDGFLYITYSLENTFG